MRQRPDLKSVITGMAQLGEIYLRIEAKIHALYAEDPKLFFQAREVMAKAGYIEDYPKPGHPGKDRYGNGRQLLRASLLCA